MMHSTRSDPATKDVVCAAMNPQTTSNNSNNIFIHDKAIVEHGVTIGDGTRVWAFAHIMPGVKIGKGCDIGDGVYIENDVVIGDNVTIKNEEQVWTGISIEDDVFVGSNVTFCNDKFPRSKQWLNNHPSLGANSTIIPGITVGKKAMVGAGSVVTHDVNPNSVVVGNPARRIRYIEEEKDSRSTTEPNIDSPETKSSNHEKGFSRNVEGRELEHLNEQQNDLESVRQDKSVPNEPTTRQTDESMPMPLGVELINFPSFPDEDRGTLTFGEYETHIPWIVKRFFMVYDTPSEQTRGSHAHRTCCQLLVCLRGSVQLHVDDGCRKKTVILSDPRIGLLVGPMIWGEQKYSKGSQLLVLCSEKFSKDGYINEYSQFIKLKPSSAVLTTTPSQQQPSQNLRVPFLNMKEIHKELEGSFKEAFNRILTSGRFVLGPEVTAFEEEWSSFCYAKHCVGLGSGLASIHLLLKAAGVSKPEHHVIVASNTYIATVLGITMAGGTPIFVEPDARTHNLDASLVEGAVTHQTVAIMCTDLYGQTSDMDALRTIARKHNIKLFSDSAQSHGAGYKGKIVGSHCDASCFSFYPSKNLGALGEAGAVVTDDADLADKIRLLRNYGSRVRYHNELKGTNERMDPIQAAMLRCKIPILSGLNDKRTRIAKKYLTTLSNLPWLSLPYVPEWSTPCWHLFVLTVKEGKQVRDELVDHLRVAGIDSLIHYPIPPHLSEAYSDLGYEHGAFPIAEMLADSVLSIPICPTLSDAQINHVITQIQNFR